MFRRRPGKSGADEASAYSRRSAVADSAWSAQDRARTGFAKAVRAAARPFERAGYELRSRVIWPLEDRTASMNTPTRALSATAVFLVAAAAVVAGLNVAGSGESGETRSAPVAVATAPPSEEKQDASEPAPAPTLQGASPVFEPTAPTGDSEVDPAKAIVKAAPAAGSAEDEASSASASSASASSSSTAPTSKADSGEPEIDGPPAGTEAIAVARDFADAFVRYETGNTDGDVRDAFGETATPALSRALLKRPPRLPANVEVPKAKVINVVPAPSHGKVYPVSVSLLRVGLTSELRLDMEQRKGAGWRVTNVLG